MILATLRPRAFPALILAVLIVWTSGCAARQPQVQTEYVPMVHVAPVGKQPGYDALYYTTGESDFFPNKDHPRRMLQHPNEGGTVEILCLVDDCNEVVVRANDLPGFNNDVLDVTRVDPKISLVRDGDTEHFRGYLAEDENGKYQFVKTLDQARKIAAGEHLDTEIAHAAVVVGDVVLIAALLAAIVVVGAAGAAAGAAGN